jgi:hypothetical protein
MVVSGGSTGKRDWYISLAGNSIPAARLKSTNQILVNAYSIKFKDCGSALVTSNSTI